MSMSYCKYWVTWYDKHEDNPTQGGSTPTVVDY